MKTILVILALCLNIALANAQQTRNKEYLSFEGKFVACSIDNIDALVFEKNDGNKIHFISEFQIIDKYEFCKQTEVASKMPNNTYLEKKFKVTFIWEERYVFSNGKTGDKVPRQVRIITGLELVE
jgi:hypothetical protein